MHAGWDYYITNGEDGPSVISVDSSLAASAPLPNLPELVLCVTQVHSFRENGLPDEAAFSIVYEFENRANIMAKKFGENVYVGHLYMNGFVFFHFYTRFGKQLAEQFEASDELNAVTRFTCNVNVDPEWSFYFDSLYPKPADRNRIENDKVRLTIKENGDEGIADRKIDHYAYFSDRQSLANFARFVKERGYIIGREDETPDERGMWALLFSKLQRPADIDAETWELTQRAQNMNGEYDGWECAVLPVHHSSRHSKTLLTALMMHCDPLATALQPLTIFHKIQNYFRRSRRD